LLVDIASPTVIKATDAEWLDYVRLYFRPRTPTQYRNEGMRPTDQRELGGAHCPVPVCLLFDSVSVLARSDSLYTDGNLASGSIPKSSGSELGNMPFNLIYHESAFEPQDRTEIVYHRHAEILIPERLDLKALRLIVCRSQAEYETLLYLLPAKASLNWVPKIAVRPNLRLFNSKWTFVEQVAMDSEKIIFRFNKGSLTPGPFRIRVQIRLNNSGRSTEWGKDDFAADNVLFLSLKNLARPTDYLVSLELDGDLAFANRYQVDDLPF